MFLCRHGQPSRWLLNEALRTTHLGTSFHQSSMSRAYLLAVLARLVGNVPDDPIQAPRYCVTTRLERVLPCHELSNLLEVLDVESVMASEDAF